MRWPNRLILLFLFVLILPSIPLSPQANGSQTATFTGTVSGASGGNTTSAMREGRAYGEEIPSVWCIRIEGGVYSMISFPYMPKDGDVLGQLVHHLGPYDLTYVTLQEFENGEYIDIPAVGKTSLEAGRVGGVNKQ